MKAFLLSLVVAIGMSVGAWYLLDTELQREAQAAFSTPGVRL